MNKRESVLDFGDFRVDADQRLLFSHDRQIRLAPKAFDTLLTLIEADGRIVEKEELLKKIWPDTFVEEGSLARNISVLRKVLGESPDDEKYIQTIPKRGYRFVAPVKASPAEEIEPADSPAHVAPRSWRSRMIGAAVLAAACLVVWQANLRRPTRGGVNPPIQSIAVLPLENLSRDPAQDYFADGITDALITSLAQIRGLKVISRTSIMRYKGTTKPLPEIARELGVDAILEGSVQRAGNNVRITAQLIRAVSDTHLWAQSYERDLSDILRLEGELASVIAREVQVQVGTDTSKHFGRAPRIAAAAQDEYLLARHQQDKRDETHLRQAIQHFEAAIRMEPSFASAYAGLANAWVQRGILGAFGFRESEVPARNAAIKAIELDPNLAEAHEALAHTLMFYDMAWVTAEREFRAAIELEPSNVYAHVYYATLLEILGRFQEAIAEGQRSLALDPVSTTVNSEYGRVLFRARRYDESIRQFQRTIELDPQDFNVRSRLVEVYIQTGRFEEALRVDIDAPLLKARAYARTGRGADARKILSKMAGPNADPKKMRDIALTYFDLGDRDRGFEWLTRAVDDRQYMSLLGCDPRFDSVSDDPRFHALLGRLRLPDAFRGQEARR
jgi:TolB-like protein/DNA-binding winged helix-turn-helix (wHTH) protein/Flp pilus assembly protein TadD